MTTKRADMGSKEMVKKGLFRSCTDARGSALTLFALATPALSLAVLGAVELADVIRMKTRLQVIVDQAALNGARQLSIDRSGSTSTRTKEAAETSFAALKSVWSVSTDVLSAADASSITVQQSAWRPSFFGNLLPPGGFHVAARARALNMPKTPLCVLSTLERSPSMSVDGNSSLKSLACLVQSNGSISVTGSSTMQAGLVQSVLGAAGSITPAPLTDTPAVADPFSTLSIAPPSVCSDENLTFDYGTHTISPGVHCGDTFIRGTSSVKLSPGEHYFTGGTFFVGGSASLTGADVVLILKNSAQAAFEGNADISLAGRETGSYAGFLLVTDRSYTGSVSISAQTARRLNGTVYLPSATLAVSGSNNTVADGSSWTVIVAKALQVSGTSNLVVNSDYSRSSVPVPAGVGPNLGAGAVRLSE